MIRNVVMGRVTAGHEAELAEGLAGILSLQLPGLLSMRLGQDAGLREGNWTFAITNDWADAESYRGYDADPTHGRYRAMIGGACDELARVQFETD